MTEPRFNHMWDWQHFSFEIGLMKPHKCTGWLACFSISIGFYYIWIYFIKRRSRMVEFVSRRKSTLVSFLKTKGYYWSAKFGRYIDDRNQNTGVDYLIQKVDELK